MNRLISLAAKVTLILGLGAALSGISSIPAAQAQDECPTGYYYDPSYGCVPDSYLTWPYYTYPDYGFDFFYGPGWGGGWGGRTYRGYPSGGGYRGGGHPSGGRGGGGGHGGDGVHR